MKLVKKKRSAQMERFLHDKFFSISPKHTLNTWECYHLPSLYFHHSFFRFLYIFLYFIYLFISLISTSVLHLYRFFSATKQRLVYVFSAFPRREKWKTLLFMDGSNLPVNYGTTEQAKLYISSSPK